MFWPIELPFKITFFLLTGISLCLILIAPGLKWKRVKTFWISLWMSMILFIPSCIAIMSIVDTRRFGEFHYETFADIDDFRVRRFLPPNAYNITFDKHSSGNRARYSVDAVEFVEYFEQLWQTYGEYSSISREALHRKNNLTGHDFTRTFGDLGWPVLDEAVYLLSPVQSNGGGAEYFFQKATGTVYQRTSYW